MCTPECCVGGDKVKQEQIHPVSPSHWNDLSFDAYREDIKISFEGFEYTGKLVSSAQAKDNNDPRPLVLVIHNYAGQKFFDEHQAEYMARLGYVGLAIDMYGERMPEQHRLWPFEQEGDTPDIIQHRKIAFENMTRTEANLPSMRGLVQAWMDAGKAHACVSAAHKPCLIGYCYGGIVCLEAIRGGLDVGGVVSFHGVLKTGGSPPLDMYLKSIGIKRPEAVPSPKTVYTTNAPVLIENGCLDKLTSAEIKTNFYKEMGENNVDFIFTDYADADHGFALPPSLGPPGKLHEKADLRSTQRMLAMFREVWPDCAQRNVPSNAAGTTILSPASL
eukprot:m.181801 g.181801  ORF g.181801 m.181801 type:complete len:332 (+) comp15519_c0_seq3:41-1036(+)